MFANYLKVALRKIVRQKFYSFINIMGLAIGLATCLLISSFVIDELSYDRHHKKAKQIYRLSGHVKMGGQESHFTTVPAPLGLILQETHPDIITAVRLRRNGTVNTYLEENIYKISEVIYADSSVFDVFTIPMMYGNPDNALKEPGSLVISSQQAEIYFGENWQQKAVVGQNIKVGENKENFVITGVYESMPSNSHFHFDMMIAMSAQKDSQADMWLSNNFFTYLLIREATDLRILEEQINLTFKKYAESQFIQFTNMGLEEFHEAGNRMYYKLMPITDIHLYSDLVGEFEANGKISYVYLFGLIAFFVLLIACVNFMNLSTARSAERAREVGIRKAIGSLRQQLILQFITEAIIMSLIASILALLFAEFALPFFNEVSGKSLSLSFIFQTQILPFTLVIILLVGVLAGSYPAFFLSAFQPIEVLQGKHSTAGGNARLRGGLVVLQFCISIILMTATLVVYQQLEHIREMELGYEKEHLLVLHNTDYLGREAKTFKKEMLRHPDIINGTVTAHIPANSFEFNSAAIFLGKDPNDGHTTSINWFVVDHDYIETMGMEILEGRNFSRAFRTDTSSIIVNEAFAKSFGLNEGNSTPVGKTVSTFGEDAGKYISFDIIGIVKDFHFQTVRDEISPMVMVLNQDIGMIGRSTYATSFRIRPGQEQQVISYLEDAWQAQTPNMPFEYSFMDERYDRLYRSEQKLGKIFSVFCILALFIACLGLFGLSSFMAEQRTKEIGIRKVLGATASQVVILLSRDFTRLVLISILISLPLAYYAAYLWLQDFAYRINLGTGMFLMAGALAVVVALITVSYQSLKAAVMNPTHALRSE